MSEFEFWKDLGNIFDAILNYQKKNVEFNNQFINPWIRLGNVFERQDKHNEAVQAYQHATEIDPDSAQNWINLGDAQFKNEQFDEAAVSYQRAINLDPQAGWPLSNLAMVWVAQGKYDQAIPLYIASISLLTDDKDKAISWNRLGNVYRKLNDYENAFLAFQRADELDGDNTGFTDKLDEAPASVAVVAPEEILEQMIVEQQLEAASTAAVEPVETPVVALAPNMEMKPEENAPQATVEATSATEETPTVPAKVASVATESVSEVEVEVEETQQDAVGPVSEEAAEPVNEVVVEEVAEVAVESVEVTQVVSEVAVEEVAVEEVAQINIESAEVTEPVSEAAEAETPEPKRSVLQLIEDVIAKVEAAAVFTEEKAEEGIAVVEEAMTEAVDYVETKTSRIPSWLIINDKTMIEKEIAEGEALVNAAELKLDGPQDDSVTTISDVPQQVAISESVVTMDIVETYTEPVVTQLSSESAVSEEIVEETQEQIEVKSETSLQTETGLEVEEVFTQETVVVQEISEAPSEVTEAAYEEYLKDVVEPSKILPDHMDEISEVPMTKISKDGEVRIAMDTKNAHVWNELGNVYLNAGAFDDAIAAYGKALELDRHFAWPYSNLALAYVQKERFAEAILLYQRGIELFASDKDKAITWNRLGNVYRRMNDYDNAISAYQTADELDPENATLSMRSNFGLLGNMQNEQKPAMIS